MSPNVVNLSLTTALLLEPKFEVGASYQARLIDESVRELTNLTLGRSFVFAVLEDGKTQAFIPHKSLVELRATVPKPNWANGLARTHKTIGELILNSGVPAMAHYWYQLDSNRTFKNLIVDVRRGMLLIESVNTALVPLSSLGYLELACE